MFIVEYLNFKALNTSIRCKLIPSANFCTVVVNKVIANYLPQFQDKDIFISLIQSCKNMHVAENA